MRNVHDGRRYSSSQTRHRKSDKYKNEKHNRFLNNLFRQIIFSGLILAILFGIKSIQSPSGKAINAYLASCFKYNIEYDWIISNINKTSEYILAILTNNK